MASRLIAYGLLFTLGLLGAHQFYLGRSLHGFVMLCSLGGFFAGWLHDLLSLERYIAESEDPFFADSDWPRRYRQYQAARQSGDMAQLASLEPHLNRSMFFRRREREKTPNYSWSRYFGESLFGVICATLWLGTFPAEWFEEATRKTIVNLTWPVPVAFEIGDLRFYIECTAPLAMAIGVFLVGNIGAHKMSFPKVLVGSYCSFVIYSSDFNNIIYGAMLTATLANWFARSWRQEPARPRSRCGRLCAVTVGTAIFFSLLAFSLLNNARVTYEGESVPLREAIRNFFKSPLWREMRDTLGKLYEYYKIHGFKEILKQLWDAFDPQGLKDAVSVIGIKEGAGIDEIRSRCRKLKVELHPDKQKDPEKKLEFQEKFQEVSAACDTLLADGKRSRKREL